MTVAELLKAHGYATAAIGKWGLGMCGTTGDPNRHGFDLFYGYLCQAQRAQPLSKISCGETTRKNSFPATMTKPPARRSRRTSWPKRR